jgi:hypothetical protein
MPLVLDIQFHTKLSQVLNFLSVTSSMACQLMEMVASDGGLTDH